VREFCIPVVFGDAGVLNRISRRLGWPEPSPVIDEPLWPHWCDTMDDPCVLDLGGIDANAVEPGTVSAACGAAAYRYFTRTIDEALIPGGCIHAIATAPINKESLHAAGFPFPGHTEILASRTNAERSCMMLTSEAITCSLVTVHVGYLEVPGLLSVERV